MAGGRREELPFNRDVRLRDPFPSVKKKNSVQIVKIRSRLFEAARAIAPRDRPAPIKHRGEGKGQGQGQEMGGKGRSSYDAAARCARIRIRVQRR